MMNMTIEFILYEERCDRTVCDKASFVETICECIQSLADGVFYFYKCWLVGQCTATTKNQHACLVQYHGDIIKRHVDDGLIFDGHVFHTEVSYFYLEIDLLKKYFTIYSFRLSMCFLKNKLFFKNSLEG